MCLVTFWELESELKPLYQCEMRQKQYFLKVNVIKIQKATLIYIHGYDNWTIMCHCSCIKNQNISEKINWPIWTHSPAYGKKMSESKWAKMKVSPVDAGIIQMTHFTSVQKCLNHPHTLSAVSDVIRVQTISTRHCIALYDSPRFKNMGYMVLWSPQDSQHFLVLPQRSADRCWVLSAEHFLTPIRTSLGKC